MTGLYELLMECLFAAAIVALVVNVLAFVIAVAFRRQNEDSTPPAVPPFSPPARTSLQPELAAVRPRVITRQSEEAYPLEDEIRSVIAAGKRGAVRIMGGPGTGKTTAIKHLMAALPDAAQVWLMDEPEPHEVSAFSKQFLVIYTGRCEDLDDLGEFLLAPWGRDDLIEYLLAVHPEACGSVIDRLGTETTLAYRGRPEIWRAILETMAADPAIPDARTALWNYLEWLQPDLEKFKATGRACLDRLTRNTPEENPEPKPPENEFERMLRHKEVQTLVAAEQLAEDLQAPVPPGDSFLARFFPRTLVEETAEILADDVDAVAHLLMLVEQPLREHALLYSLLHAIGIDCPPEFGCEPVLVYAYLKGVSWPGADLAAGVLDHADFDGADLHEANLDASYGRNAKLRGANLHGASMISCEFAAANLSRAHLTQVNASDACFEHAELLGANLQGALLLNTVFTNANLKNARLEYANLCGAFLTNANLEGANFAKANLALAKLMDAKLEDADFTDANLEQSQLKSLCFKRARIDGVNFRQADMESCDLEGIECRDVNFERANLNWAKLTGTTMTNANFAQANLRGAKLAEISWEGADLRGADLFGATFHMGTTRSGLLFTGIASEGTRTGFYTDESREQSFQAPEDIRKANLCGADLRGALLSEVDFYLVDLRGAIYDPHQAEHFRRCGAILNESKRQDFEFQGNNIRTQTVRSSHTKAPRHEEFKVVSRLTIRIAPFFDNQDERD
jgi:uncharacterized protein YjbI with pentapeptide repeats